MLLTIQPILTAILALLAVLALIWAASRAAKFSGIGNRRPAGRLLQVEEAIALDPRRRLHLVSCEGRRVLLLTGGAQDLVVGWLPDRAAP
jgi:flagellar protein FliO/FliZ